MIDDGENGRLVDSFSPTEIAARLIDGLAEPRAFYLLREKNAADGGETL